MKLSKAENSGNRAWKIVLKYGAGKKPRRKQGEGKRRVASIQQILKIIVVTVTAVTTSHPTYPEQLSCQLVTSELLADWVSITSCYRFLCDLHP
jgi:hypothetical protein